MRATTLRAATLAAGWLLLGSPLPGAAHGFGQRYDLPVPLWLWVAGAGAAVAFSFVVIGLFVRGAPGVRAYPRVNLLQWPVGRLLSHPGVLLLLRGVSVGLFVLLILAGLLGDQHPLRNLAPTLVWIVWWVGLAYVSALAGDLWALISPWKAIFGWAEALYRRVNPGGELSLSWPYPRALGTWPAVVLFWAFAWVELVFDGSAVSFNLAVMASGYALLMWIGMFLFGKERWLRWGDAFSVAFGVLARFAPTEVRIARREVCHGCDLDCRTREGDCINCYECFSRARAADREWNLRPYAVGLLRTDPAPTSSMVFVLLLLSTVTFDGFMATPAWSNLETRLSALLPPLAGFRLTVIRTLGLASFPALFLAVYIVFGKVMAVASGARRPAAELVRIFVFTLVPIAIAYHAAHYLSFLLIQGQRVIPLASDPFGFGWNLLGTAGYRVDIAIVGARFAWHTAVVAIVVGHIIAVYLAHSLAVQTLEDRGQALRSQYPMLALMVGYTTVSLWILAQPIVEREVRPPAAEAASAGEITIPPDALIPEPGTGTLRPVPEGRRARARITYRLLSSAFHDGTETTVADLLYPYVFAYRWGARTAPKDAGYDPLVDRSTALIRERLAGVRVVGVDRSVRAFGEFKLQREVPIIEVYLDSSLWDPSRLAALAPPWSTLPWHLIALMEEGVRQGWVAFSLERAQQKRVEWLDLVRSAPVKARLAALAEEFERRRYRPEALGGLVTPEQARERWAALRKFYQERGHFLVTNGPYVLKEWTRHSATLQVFRDASYPLGVGSFDDYPIPRKAFFSRLALAGDRLEIEAEVERLEKFQRTYALSRVPFRGQTSDRPKPDVLVCRYVILSPAGEVVRAGTTRLRADGVSTVELRPDLPPGLYSIVAALYLNGNSMNPDIRQIPYRVPGGS